MKEVRTPKQKEVADEGSKTLPQPAARSTPDTHKRLRESTASPEVPAAKKPAEKRPRASKKEKKWVEVPNRKDLRNKKKKEKKLSTTPQKSCRAKTPSLSLGRGVTAGTAVRHYFRVGAILRRCCPLLLAASSSPVSCSLSSSSALAAFYGLLLGAAARKAAQRIVPGT